MSKIDSIELDVLMSEKFSESVATTEHPVEEGADPTDHVRIKPSSLQIEAMFTNTPIPADPLRNPESYAQEQYKQLQALKLGRAITVSTGARDYPNMQLTELAQTRDSSTGTGAIQFTAAFKEIIIVKTETVRLTQTKKKTAVPKTPTGKVDQSKQPSSEDDPSLLHDLLDHENVQGMADALRARTAK